MIYLSGTYSRTFAPLLTEPGFGLLVQPLTGLREKIGSSVWAADNGCFSRPDEFDAASFLDWLRSHDLARCLFATAPDVLADASETTRRSEFVLPLLRESGIRAAYVAQDGLTTTTTPWSAFDALFIGGTTEWKYSSDAYKLARSARVMGKWIHVGRVNSEKALQRARWLGADSVDGNFLKFAPDSNVRRLVRWFRQGHLDLRATA